MKTLFILIVLVVLVIAWYLFRPEKLLISSKVNEEFPQVTETGNPKIIFEGNFKGVAHDAAGVATIYDMVEGNRFIGLTDMTVSNGPEAHVYLVADKDPMDNDTAKQFEIYQFGP